MGESRGSKIWKRTLVGGSLALALTALLYWADSNSWVLVVVPALLGLGACLEVGRMLDRGTGVALLCGTVVCTWLTAREVSASGLERFVSFLEGSGYWSEVYLAGAVLPAVAALLWWRGNLGRALRTLALGAWIVPPLFCLLAVRLEWGMSGLVSLLLLSKIGDIAGYYVGNAIGRTHPFPKLSPGKTTEGCLGSLAGGTLAGALLAWQDVLPGGVAAGALAGALVNVAAQAGDLVESGLKRRCAVKDSGTWFGPSGGALDVVDSLLTTVPVALILWPVVLNG